MIKYVIISFFLTKSDTVYICNSGTAYAYHTTVCEGLGMCSHCVDTVTIAEANKRGFIKPCGYCKKKSISAS